MYPALKGTRSPSSHSTMTALWSTTTTRSWLVRSTSAGRAPEIFVNAPSRLFILHGAIAGRAFGEYTHPLDGATVRDIASGIRVIHDPMPTNDPGFEAAYELLKRASKVCLLGFGYHPENLRRLRLKSLLENRGTLYGTAVGLGKAELHVARSRIGMGFRAGRPGGGSRGVSTRACATCLEQGG